MDHYLDVPFDLSKVMFITTANYLEPVPPALRDRMEVIELAGYTEEEKLEIARRHLIPKQRAENGLTEDNIEFRDEGVQEIIRSYTREAGLRNLEREIGRVCRKVARGVTEGKTERVMIDAARVREFLGPERFFSEVAERVHEPGVATGLAWTPNGGEILFIEATRMTGKKGLTLTGHLGEVMKESAQAALSFIRARRREDRTRRRLLREQRPPRARAGGRDPEGRALRGRGDGRGAGFAAHRPHRTPRRGHDRRDHAARQGAAGRRHQGEGARRQTRRASSTVILPKRNAKDLEELTESVRREMTFICVETIDEALEHALEPKAEAPTAEQALAARKRAAS